MLLSTLAGFVIPFGGVVAPFFFDCKTIDDLRFRKLLVWVETIITIAGMIFPVLKIIGSVSGFGEDVQIDTDQLTTGILLNLITPACIILAIIVLWRSSGR